MLNIKLRELNTWNDEVHDLPEESIFLSISRNFLIFIIDE